jgi:hypothetical protein
VETRSGCNYARIALGQKGSVAEFSSIEFLIAAMIAEIRFYARKGSAYFGIIGCSGARSFLLVTSATPNSLMSLAAV